MKGVWHQEVDDNGYSWLGWTCVNGKLADQIAVIESKQPVDPIIAILRTV